MQRKLHGLLATGVGERAASQRLSHAGFATDRTIEIATERAAALQQRMFDKIRAKPLQDLGFAAMIGLFVGFSVEQ
ncbi:hypothetical protein AB4099_33860 [Bosea sp. 2KB_26]|uniref:hypothetical protein n=1 Tax=Bosea sp. 2KB_26 TaxID=3237475 RepID=UPI003F927618